MLRMKGTTSAQQPTFMAAERAMTPREEIWFEARLSSTSPLRSTNKESKKMRHAAEACNTRDAHQLFFSMAAASASTPSSLTTLCASSRRRTLALAPTMPASAARPALPIRFSDSSNCNVSSSHVKDGEAHASGRASHAREATRARVHSA